MTRSDALTEIFKFMDHKVRVVIIDKVPWFSVMDTCIVLGLKKNERTRAYSNHTANLDHSERRTVKVSAATSINGSMAVISESGLYKLIMRSRKPEAKKFQNWVTQVVLPAIRKDGLYVRGEEKVSAGEMDLEELTLITLTRLQEKMKRLKEEKEAAEALAKFSQGIITEHLEYVTMDE
ncbi:Bro-N domain-containing protein [Brucella sp. 10RB9210]|uniref:BRO-N domain-containing protein n=1 Tax=Brucella sp. 10RB9210 TaxID=1844037 RepID=UPI0012AD24A1|nr:Bro-N domain-containing protein [Brucella sp. 10RB9210]MRN76928.1 BRO family protein [Brucella sp. 10RB9210]